MSLIIATRKRLTLYRYTGAGNHITGALMQGHQAPPKFIEAMEQICERATTRGCRIWIDAEQQFLQATIDQWTFDFMRRFNRPEQRALIYNTVQAYLKSSRDKIDHQLQLAQKEGWRSGIKLVRGAYISNDIRERIHDTKAETDASYNGIVQDALKGEFPALAGTQTAQFDLLLAGHNTKTIRTATRLATELAAQSRLKVVPEFDNFREWLMTSVANCSKRQTMSNSKMNHLERRLLFQKCTNV